MLLPQNLHKLIQHAAEDFPQLGGFLRLLHPSRIRLPVHPLRQRRFQMKLLHKPVQGFHIGPGRCPGLQALRQTAQRAAHPAAQFVHLIQPVLPQLIPRRTVAVRVFRPVHVPQPHLAMDLPFQDIVFQ